MLLLYREAPLASIWEDSGNVAALDALRALTGQPESAEALFADSTTVRTLAWIRPSSGYTRNFSDPSEARATPMVTAG